MEALVAPYRPDGSHRQQHDAGADIFANHAVQRSHDQGSHTKAGLSVRDKHPLETSAASHFSVQEEFTPAVEPVPTSFAVDENVIAAFPDKGAVLISAEKSGESLWGATACLQVRLPSGEIENYFLKVVRMGETGRIMCHGEFESLKAIYKATPGFCPKPYAWGRYKDEEAYFLLVEFRYVGHQPADASQLGEALANMHKKSRSPTGKFGFHIRTCHARIAQAVDFWDDSWCVIFQSHLGHVIDLAKPILQWPEFNVVADLVLTKVVPRLLLPLQEDGRMLKPCLVHGDCWDGNTAMDAQTGAPFIFDVCTFYAHNEYDIGNWRAPRHRLSAEPYVSNYKDHFEVSQPEEEWDSRNLLYSLPYNIGNAIYVPGSDQRPVIYEDMKQLCSIFCAEELAIALESHVERAKNSQGASERERQRSEQEDDVHATKFLGHEKAVDKKVDDDDDDDEDDGEEEEETDKEVLARFNGTDIAGAFDSHVDIHGLDPAKNIGVVEEPHSPQMDELRAKAVAFGDSSSDIPSGDAQITSLGQIGTSKADEMSAPAMNHLQSESFQLEKTESLPLRVAGHGGQAALPEEKKMATPDALRQGTNDPNATQETNAQDSEKGRIGNMKENTLIEQVLNQDADWEDIDTDGAAKKAGAMRKRTRTVKRRKRRVLSSW